MMPTRGTRTISTWGEEGVRVREHTHILCRYLTTAVRLARLGRSVDQALANFDLVVRCSLNEACNYLHAGRIRVDLRMLRFERAKAGNRGDALMVIMCRSAESFARRVGRAMMFEWGRGPTTTAEAQEAAVGVGPGSRMQGTRPRHLWGGHWGGLDTA